MINKSSAMTIVLPEPHKAFASGGNRLCFTHPNDSSFCIKVARPDRLPQQKKASKGFPKNLKPLSFFDENLQEIKVYNRIDRWIGRSAYQLIPRHKGIVETNYGSGFISEIVTDTDGRISISLKQFVWQHGVTPALNKALTKFKQQWSELGMPSRNLLLHNIVVQQHGDDLRLVVIDGLGWADVLPIAYWIPEIARRKALRKVNRLGPAINNLLDIKAKNKDKGQHGWIDESKREINNG